MDLPGISSPVYHLRHRTVLLVLGPPIAAFCLWQLLRAFQFDEPWLGWALTLGLWLSILLGALRRRLVLTPEGVEYTTSLRTIRVRWSRINGLLSRRVLGIWAVDGLSVRTEEPEARDLFIDLRQFSRAWREESLGAAIRQRVPHLFR